MKKLIFMLFGIMLMGSVNVNAQVEGKVYATGDTVIMDGMNCIVIKTDETGMHGKAISPIGRTRKEIDKLKASILKDGEKRIKKGETTREEVDAYVAQAEANSKLPRIIRVKDTYQTGAWLNQIPSGWRLPSTEDAEDFAIFYCGGIGKDHSVKNMYKKNMCSDKLAQETLIQLAFAGFICYDYQHQDIKFLRQWKTGRLELPVKFWLEIKDKYAGTEKTIAVKEF